MRDAVKRSWKIRRRIILSTLTFCAAGVGYLLGWGGDTRLNETLANGLLLLAGSTIGSYVFGAAWDDMNADKHVSRDGLE